MVISFLLLFAFSIHAKKKYHFEVSKDGTGDFELVQDAINAVPDMRKEETIIFIRKGIYNEKLILPASKTNVTFIGENLTETVLTNNDFSNKLNSFGEKMGTSGSSSFFLFGDGFKGANLTFENSSGDVGQAVAVRIDADKVIFDNCRFLGFQDTLYPYGKESRQFYYNCYIEGATDFIFGWSTAVFQNCEIYSKAGGSYITAASTLESTNYGLVFIDCKLTGDASEGTVYLGRPWRDFAQTVFINCEMGSHIHPEGWHNWNKPHAEQTAFYAEYNSSGEGGKKEKRVSWSRQLEESDLIKYELANIFKDWNPLTNLEAEDKK